MTWICPLCSAELGELNGYCLYCKINDNTLVYNPDEYYIRDIRVEYITTGKGESMTPQEELFAKLFNHAKILVKDMDILELRAKREEWAKIAFEARAYLTAADDEELDRKKKSSPKGPTGFSRNLNTDETTTNAINTIRERQKKLTGKEKIREGLVKLFQDSGMTELEAQKEADSRMGAGAILKVRDDKAKGIVPEKAVAVASENKPVFNPFEKK